MNEKVLSVSEKTAYMMQEIKREVLFYSALNDEASMSESGMDSLEKIFALSNEVLTQDDADNVITSIFSDFIKLSDTVAFNVFNNVLHEICFSDSDNNSEQHTLLFINVAFSDIITDNLNGANVNLDGFQEIISNALFQNGIVGGLDEVKMSRSIIPTNQIKDIPLKTWYDFTTDLLNDGETVLDFKFDYSAMNSEPIKSFYIPVLVKGEHDELIEILYDKTEEIEESIESISSTVLKNPAIVFSYIMPYSDADEETPMNLLNGGKLLSFLAFIEEEKTPHSEFALLDVEGDEKSVVVLSLDSQESTVKAFLILKKVCDKLTIWEELSSFSTRTKIKFLMSHKKLSVKVIQEIENSKSDTPASLTESSENQLKSVFEYSYHVDSDYLYLIATGGATQTVH